MRELLSAAFPSTQLYFFLRLVEFVNEPFRTKAKKLLTQALRKRHLPLPTTLPHLLLPPVHALQNLGFGFNTGYLSIENSFLPFSCPSFESLKHAVPHWGAGSDDSFPCSCFDVTSPRTMVAHSHAVFISGFDEINTLNVTSASMKDNCFGDVETLRARLALQIRKLSRRWNELLKEHSHNIQQDLFWTAETLQHTARALKPWVVIPAPHFPSRAHVICPTLFSTLLHRTFCTGKVFALATQPAVPFRTHVVTTTHPCLQQQYSWGFRLHDPLPTARILPKPSKDWLKARPIISFFRTWASPLLTVFGALIFELTKNNFPHVPGQLPVQDLVQQLWDALSTADPTEYIQLISQDLSGFFTSIPVERFPQALQVLLHQYDIKVGLSNVSLSQVRSSFNQAATHD